ncbi:unnamed protein product [Porites lobata]|uniref:Uncharacterized protein n=1 Tax=Porites lobata TaxID=104759 RepID=A0ABN8NU91_9CNID|nr:unnamed protein product [Porites lobata]
MRQEKQKKKAGEKAKSKSQDCCVTFKLEILLSAHARTSQADILHLDQKAAKCTTCKPVCVCLLVYSLYNFFNSNTLVF